MGRESVFLSVKLIILLKFLRVIMEKAYINKQAFQFYFFNFEFDFGFIDHQTHAKFKVCLKTMSRPTAESHNKDSVFSIFVKESKKWLKLGKH